MSRIFELWLNEEVFSGSNYARDCFDNRAVYPFNYVLFFLGAQVLSTVLFLLYFHNQYRKKDAPFFSIISFCKYSEFALMFCGFFPGRCRQLSSSNFESNECAFAITTPSTLWSKSASSLFWIVPRYPHTADQIEEFWSLHLFDSKRFAIFAQKGSESIVSPWPHNQNISIV